MSNNNSNNDDFQKTFAIGKQALGYIKYNSTPAIPNFYELWYTYASGYNKDLIGSIQKILDEDKFVSPEIADQLYKKFIAPERLSDRAEEISVSVGEELKDIVDLLGVAATKTGSYGDSLEGVKGEIAHVTTPAELKELVQKVILETTTMASQSRHMEKQLEESHNQISELRANLEAVRAESLTDQLTGLGNRKLFDQKLKEHMQSANENDEPLCLLITDIDHFKKFNDTYGHQTGDQVLRLVAHTLKENVKGQDIAARYGGEEFAIILPGTTIKNALSVSENVRQAVQVRELIKKSTNTSLGRVTISIGVSCFKPGDTASTLIHRADACLYAAKHAGRNNVKSELDDDINMEINAA